MVKPFGKVVICGATSGFQLDFDVRYLWMRQKQIIGSHFANAYECMRANQLMAEGKIRPVLWQTMDFDGIPAAHQLMHENKHLGKIAYPGRRRVRGRGQDRGGSGRDPGRGRGVNAPAGHAKGLRHALRLQTRLAHLPLPGRALVGAVGARRGPVPAYGAKSWSLTRADEDPLAFQQTMVWENKADFERYWFSAEINDARESVIDWYVVPLLPAWHTLIAAE